MRTRTACWTMVLMLLQGPALAAAPLASVGAEFSADVVHTQLSDGATTHTKLYVGRAHIRLEPPPVGQEPTPIILLHLAESQVDVLQPTQQRYSTSSTDDPPARAFVRGLRFFQPIDPTRPCAAFGATVTCHPIGHETVNGRATQKWEGTVTGGETGVLWIDPHLRFIVKLQGVNTVTELQHIEEAPQPAVLFAIPAGYHLTDWSLLMRSPPPHP
jgi:hypothetical protein